MDDRVLRQAIAELLDGESAHVGLRKALEGVPAGDRSKRPAEGIHSAWEELEHMRIAQEDILRYTLDPAWTSPPWPDGYWPAETKSVSDADWDASVEAFFRDLEEVVRLVTDESFDLTSEIPHGERRTYLRQALLVADHNAYHVGQLVAARKMLGSWESG